MQQSVLTLVLTLFFGISTLVLAVLIYLKAKSNEKQIQWRTEECLSFILNVLVNCAPDPKTVRRLIDDVNATGEWRGSVDFDSSTGRYHIAWEPQEDKQERLP